MLFLFAGLQPCEQNRRSAARDSHRDDPAALRRRRSDFDPGLAMDRFGPGGHEIRGVFDDRLEAGGFRGERVGEDELPAIQGQRGSRQRGVCLGVSA